MDTEEKLIEKVVDAPAEILGGSVTMTKSITYRLRHNQLTSRTEKYWSTLGPGLVTGASDDDPSGIATYSQAGAQYGTSLLWLSLFTLPFMGIIQEMCARIALVTGRGLTANMKKAFPIWVLYLSMSLLFIANTLNIGADLGAMAKSVQLVVPGFNFSLLVIFFGIGGLLLEIFVSYRVYARYLKWMALVLLSYVASVFLINIDWGTVLANTIIPKMEFSKKMIFIVTAVLGTTISPYLFFWQTSQEVEERILRGKTTLKARKIVTDDEIKIMRRDVWTGMILSNVVMFCIMVVCAATLFANGITNITTATDAALALKPIAGNSAFLLFALGIIGTGLLAIPILAASVSYTVAETFSWHEGLYRKLRGARSFYGVMIVAMLVGLLLNFLDIHPIKALIYSAIANALIAPVILIAIVNIASNKKVMGVHANSTGTNILGWVIIGAMMAAGLATIISLFVA